SGSCFLLLPWFLFYPLTPTLNTRAGGSLHKRWPYLLGPRHGQDSFPEVLVKEPGGTSPCGVRVGIPLLGLGFLEAPASPGLPAPCVCNTISDSAELSTRDGADLLCSHGRSHREDHDGRAFRDQLGHSAKITNPEDAATPPSTTSVPMKPG